MTRKLLVLWVLLALPGRTPAAQTHATETSRNHGGALALLDFSRMAFIGEVTFPTGYQFQGVELGGLSGITFDAAHGRYYAICDDQGKYGPSRFYTLQIDLSDGKLDDGDVRFTGMVRMLTPAGQPFGKAEADPEGIAFTPSGTLFISSEGATDWRVKPFVREFSTDGAYLGALPLPDKYIPNAGRKKGVRENLAFESLTITPDHRFLFTATENALSQDGPKTDLGQGSAVRILKYDLAARQEVAEYVYQVGPVSKAPAVPDGFRVNGLAELAALSEDHLLALERGFSAGVGMVIRLFEVDLSAADNVIAVERLDPEHLRRIQTARKTLRLDFARLGILLDNLEGMTFGPELPDGRQSFIVVSDNNFNRRGQFTQFLAFAVPKKKVLDVAAIHAIQGAGHTSPLLGQFIENVTGIVTAVDNRGRNRGFWMQDPDGDHDPATSEGLFVYTGEQTPNVQVGDSVTVSGTVEEFGRPGELTVTQLTDAEVTVHASGHVLPAAIVIGEAGRIPPDQIIEDDSLKVFDPETDGIDFYESLEGMRVRVAKPVVVGPTARFGEFAVLADDGKHASVRSVQGGIVVRPNDFNPERILVNEELVEAAPRLNVGDRLAGDLLGVVHYSFGNFKLLLTRDLPEVVRGHNQRERTELKAAPDVLTVATYNVENLDFKDPAKRFRRIAQSIVDNLASPDILALQEVQDNNGPTDDGTVDASQTLQRLVEEIRRSGGPEYNFSQINPENNADGGQPGGNIRVAYLYNPARVELVVRGHAGPRDPARLIREGKAVHLDPSPARVAPQDPAFARNEASGFEASRKSLAAEFRFNGQTVFIINNHLKSKRGDGRLFGAQQPPVLRSEIQRRAQAVVIHNFVEKLLTADPDANVIVLGDMNEHEFRAPMEILAGTLLTDLIKKVPLAERYTFIFNGNSQVLDHIFVSRNLLEHAAPAIDIVHVNAGFAADERASDHEPVVAAVKLPRR
ncbi:MAG: hypothetical protein D6743_05490 [Calditrichaeota bacterium]|nr:MAG: hypothetical protein D6743_05490 [Calditrichota bacterium]